MGDPDSELASRLAGGTEGVLEVYDAAVGDLLSYAWFLLAPGRHAADDGPADAVLDALLVAGETIGELVAPTLTRAWLYALVRNECLRAAHQGGPPAELEAAELAGRHGLTAAEVAAVLGRTVRPAADPGAPVPPKNPPGWLRAELVAALGVEAAGRRAELAARAHPYDPEGFPVPVDSRRLSSRALAWSAAAAVAVGLVLLVTLPTGGGAASGALPGPVRAAAVVAPLAVGSAPAPLPTLHASPFGAPVTSVAPRPEAATDRGADRRDVTTPPAGTAPAPAAGRSRTDGTATGDDDGWRRTALLVAVRSDGRCGGTWTASVRAWAYSREQRAVARVTASAPGAGTVALSAGGGTWSGRLSGLPAGEVAVTVTATAADGSPLRSVTRQVGC